ncbi:MAG: APC family permease [Candidatus ainarchaeum sp.]|nr:APC family permease [Candidatus ainarchaeum sp.]
MKQVVTLTSATIYGIGVIVGAGIYALIGVSAGISGNAIWISFILAAVIASLTAFSYVELSSRFVKESAASFYVKKAFGSKFFSFFTGFLSFIIVLFSSSAVAFGFATYLKAFIPFHVIIIAIFIIILCAIVNLFGMKLSINVTKILTVVSVIGLLILIVFGLRFINPSINLFAGINGEQGLDLIPVLFSSVALIFFSYLGFEEIANISEEVINPEKNVPKAIIFSLFIVTIIYVLVSIVSISVISPATLALASNASSLSQGPLALVADKVVFDGFGVVLSFIALFATASTLLVLLVGASRLIYGLSEQNLIPKIFTKVSKKNNAPYLAILLSTVLTILFLFLGNLEELGNLTTMGTFLLFFIINCALIVVRFKEKRIISKIHSPLNFGYVPLLAVVGAIFCLFMFLTQYWQPVSFFGFQLPMIIFGLIMFSLSLPIYFLFNKKSDE